MVRGAGATNPGKGGGAGGRPDSVPEGIRPQISCSRDGRMMTANTLRGGWRARYQQPGLAWLRRVARTVGIGGGKSAEM